MKTPGLVCLAVSHTWKGEMEVSSFVVGIHFGSLVNLLKELLLHSDLSSLWSFPLLSLFQRIAGIRGDFESLGQSNALSNQQHGAICVVSAARQTFLFHSAPSGLVVVTVTANATPFVLMKFTETDLYKEVDANTCLRECTGIYMCSSYNRVTATIRH